MADNTGAQDPAAAINQTSPTTSWTNLPDSVFTSDDRRSVYTGTTKDTLFVTDFTMGVPASSTITAIIVTSEAQGTASQAVRRRLDIHLVKNGRDIVGDHVAFNHDQNSDNIVTLSGSTDSLWNTTWTESEINATTFGLAIVKNATQAGDISGDHFTINVHYTIGGDEILTRRRRIQ